MEKTTVAKIWAGVDYGGSAVSVCMSFTEQIERDPKTKLLAWIAIVMMTLVILFFVGGMWLARAYHRMYGADGAERRMLEVGLECYDSMLGHKTCEP